MRGKNPNEKIAERYGGGECTSGGKWNGTIRLATERVLTEPLRVKKPQVWAAWNDLFHKDVSVADIIRVFEIMWQCPQHVFIILTKRYERMKAVMSGAIANAMGPGAEPATHIWLGVTAENQEMADLRIPILLQTPAAKRFVSVEPMLAEMDIEQYFHDSNCNDSDVPFCICSEPREIHVDWLIIGDESGPGRRVSPPGAIRALKDQAVAAGVPVFIKQADINGCLVKMPILDGRVWDQVPGGKE
jgi:protein gp37